MTMQGLVAPLSALFCIALSCAVAVPSGRAETISGALSRAYIGNPDLNQQRAGTRASDEVVARSKAGFRPTVAGTGQFGPQFTDEKIGATAFKGSSFPTSAGLTVTQNIFNGNRTVNGVRQAESQVFQSREQTRNTEQNTLLNGATAYMNVLRDTAILELNKNNITVLEEQLRQTRDRFTVGEVTRTDVAQAESSLATARSNYFTAQANLQTSIANYRQIIGVEPRRLEAARPIDPLLPRTLENAIVSALAEHPSIQAAFHNVDAAQLQVQVNEGALYPTVNAVANVQQSNQYTGIPQNRLFQGSVVGQVSVPLYSGGDTYASVRQAKELLSQARLQADLQRDMVRANVVSTWGQLESAKAVIRSSQAAVKSSEIALDGVREEAKVGQRTHARRADGAADVAAIARQPGIGAARQGGGELRGVFLDRAPLRGESRSQRDRIRSDHPLHPGQGQVDRPADTGWAVTPTRVANCFRRLFVFTACRIRAAGPRLKPVTHRHVGEPSDSRNCTLMVPGKRQRS